MCACEPGYECAAHRALPDYRCDDYPELPDEGEAVRGGGEREASEGDE